MLTAIDLKTEYQENPICVGKNPRFSWKLTSAFRAQNQLAYQVRVYEKKGEIVWDSGKVYSRESVGIAYAGKPLKSQTEYVWRVCVWDSEENSCESAETCFETGLDEKDWQGAEWIGANTQSAPLLRKVFALTGERVEKARAYFTGLGFAEAYLNGKKIGNALLEPCVTQYHKRFFYSAYDVTALLSGGKNALGVALGRGYYSMLGNGKDWQTENWANAPWRDERKLRFRLWIKYADGTEQNIFSNTSWTASESPLTFDMAYYGEVYDARKELAGWKLPDFDDATWQSARLMRAPEGAAEPSAVENNAVAERFVPVSKNAVSHDVIVFDFGKITCGWCAIRVRGERGKRVKLAYSELLGADGSIDRRGLINDIELDGERHEAQTDEYILKGGGEEQWEAAFTYKGFRYVQVTADGGVEILSICAKAVHTNVRSIGEFACSNEKLNAVHELCRRSLLNNYHGYPSDTPVYENLGYLADGHITQDSAAYNFDTARFYEKWAADIRLQVKPDGYVEQTAPMWDEDKENAPEWALAAILVPWQHYLFYGDKRVLAENYVEMQRVFAYQLGLAQDGISVSMWGDHDAELKTLTPTAYLYHSATVLAEIAKLLRDERASEYLAAAERIKSAFVRAFYNEERGDYREKDGEFHVNAQVFPLAFGIATNEQKQALLQKIKAQAQTLTRLDCGILSLKYFFRLLTENGLGELALSMILDEKYRSFGYLLSKDATTLWEFWGEDSRSFDHHMYATVDEYFYTVLGGIQRDGVGFSSLIIRPYVQTLVWCKAATETVRGRVECAWKKTQDGLNMEIVVPANVTATVYIPLGKTGGILENGAPIQRADGVKALRTEAGCCVCEIGGGRYAFISK